MKEKPFTFLKLYPLLWWVECTQIIFSLKSTHTTRLNLNHCGQPTFLENYCIFAWQHVQFCLLLLLWLRLCTEMPSRWHISKKQIPQLLILMEAKFIIELSHKCGRGRQVFFIHKKWKRFCLTNFAETNQSDGKRSFLISFEIGWTHFT